MTASPAEVRSAPHRLAVVLSHPIQYFSPWFQRLATEPGLALRVFYLWDFGVAPRFDRAFDRQIQWDIPLLEGYDHEFVPNASADPGTHHFGGLDNPRLVDALCAWRPDAILMFGYLFRSHLRVLFSRRLAGVPRLLRGDSHDLFRPPGLRTHLARLARSALFRRFDGFLAVGIANTQYYLHAGVPRRKIHFAPHCVDNERFQGMRVQAHDEARAWRAELGIREDAPLILFAGKLEQKKRPLDLLAAFGTARERLSSQGVPEPALLIVGSGNQEDALRHAAGELGGRGVFFAPFQNQSKMPTVYATCDLFVLPSHGSGETWGLAVNEAMNLGKPVLASDHVGCAADLVRPGETGWTFEAGNRAALAEALVDALSLDPAARASMGDHARALVSRYSYRAATDGLLLALRSVRDPHRHAAEDAGHA